MEVAVVTPPLLCFLLIYTDICLVADRRARPFCWRGAFISAAVIWGILVSVITELLSLFNSITRTWILTAWVVANTASAVICLLYIGGQRWRITPKFPKLQPREMLLVACIGFIFLTTCVTALVAPPNNWDSMTYNMASVVHWIQNQNVALYPTHIDRQLYDEPWSEFAIMHLQVLTQGDRFANTVQWFSMVGSAIGVS